MAMEAFGEEGQVKLLGATKFSQKAISFPWANDISLLLLLGVVGSLLCCLSHSHHITSFIDSTLFANLNRNLKIAMCPAANFRVSFR